MFRNSVPAMMRRAGPVAPAAMRHVAAPMGMTPAMWAFQRWLTARPDVRNVAVIAHVDHGKTTLVDSMLKQSGTMEGAKGRVMDSKDQEKERGITILAKNTAVVLKDGRRINIVDTPGHLDFSGEVERALQMVEGFVLLVDAAEGVKPGTRYVLRKALALNLRPIVFLNKIDKDASLIEKTESDLQDLFLETAVNDDQLDMFFLYGSGRSGYANETPEKEGTLDPLFEAVFSRVPAPEQPSDDSKFQMLVASIAEGPVENQRIAIGRIFRGDVKKDDIVTVVLGDKKVQGWVKDIRLYLGVEHTKAESASFGDVVALTIQDPLDAKIPLEIGASVCDKEHVEPWPYHPPDAPTFSLVLQESGAVWKEKEADQKMGRIGEIRKRLKREAMVNTALRLEDVDTPKIKLLGRGPLHLSVIIEDMRREGFEFELQAPSVMTKVIDGVVHEPYEKLLLEYDEKLAAEVVSMLSQRMGEIGDIKNLSNGRLLVDCIMPVRLMLDLPLQFNRLTGGNGVLNHTFDEFRPEACVSSERQDGALVALEEGEVQAYSLSGLAQHGRFFVQPGDYVYYGQVVGENNKIKNQDMPVNVTKKNEQQGGLRANSMDASKKRSTSFSSTVFSLEDAIAWVTPHELVTVTPKSIRLRRPGFNGKTMMRNHGKKK